MAVLENKTESEFPRSKQEVFDALMSALDNIDRMEILNSDELQGRVNVKAKAGSWGTSYTENITIQLFDISENKTKITEIYRV